MAVYRFLLTPRWLGILALTLVAATVMVFLGNWQLDRYRGRTEINERIDAGARMAPTPLRDALSAPTGGAGTAGPAPAEDKVWTRVTVTGRYDPSNMVLVRSRTVDSRVGFEVVTPLVLGDGTAVLVDRGWIPPAPGGATARPDLPATPSGEVTVVGRVHESESGAGAVERRDGRLETRRIAVPGWRVSCRTRSTGRTCCWTSRPRPPTRPSRRCRSGTPTTGRTSATSCSGGSSPG